VHGDVHTNRIKNVCSLFERSVVGAYHKNSVKHPPTHLDEFMWRYNNRGSPFLFRDTILKLLSSPNLQYKRLVGKQA
jgi:hypothetical protein